MGSVEEKMLSTLGANLVEIGKKTFGAGVKIELHINDAPVSKVALIQECNPETKTTNEHRAKVTGDGYEITVADGTLPF